MIGYGTWQESVRAQLLVSPLSARLLVLAVIFICLVLGRDLLREWLRSAARVLLGLPDEDPLTFLELTFPTDTYKSAFATSQLYALLQSGTKNLSWLEQLAVRPRRYSLELVATKPSGIRYLLAVPESQVPAIHFSLLSYLPGLRVRETTDYLPGVARSKTHVTDLRLSSDYLLPLRGQGEQRFHDPIAFISGQMQALGPSDLVAYQLVLSPVSKLTHPRLHARLTSMRDTIMRGLPASPALRRPLKLPGLVLASLWVLEHTLGLLLHMLLLMLVGQSPAPKVKEPPDPPPPLPKHEQALTDAVLAKTNDHLFESAIRVLVATPDKATTQARSEAVLSAFRLFTSHYQSLVPKPASRGQGRAVLAQTAFGRRVLPVRPDRTGTVLGTGELTDLYHFPNTSQTSGAFLKTRTPELPLPFELASVMSNHDAQYGVNRHAGLTTPIRIPASERARHTYVFGRTGTGKTTLLTQAIYDDLSLTTGGLAVLDPHGDLHKHLMGIMPPSRTKDVIVFDPSERDWPIGLNLLNPGIQFKDDIESRDRITSSVIQVFEKLSGDFWGPRMEHVLRNVTLTALTTKDPNLFTLQRLLTDRTYMQEVSQTLKDPVLRQFWDQELSKVGDFALSSLTLPLTSRLGHFLTTGMSRHILLQKHTAISMSEVMDQGKVLLVNLSKGELGEDQSSFFGTIISSMIWMAAQARAIRPESTRRDFYVYVDEFQNFATRNFAEIVSEGRKFHVALTLAHQSVAQIEDHKIIEVIAGNAGTIITFAGSPTDEAFLQPFLAPVIQPGEILNLPPRHFFIKTRDVPGADAFSGTTAPPSKLPPFSQTLATTIQTQSKFQYGVHRSLLDHYFLDLFPKPKDPAKDLPPKRRRHKPMKPQSSPTETKASQPRIKRPVPRTEAFKEL